MNLAEDENPPTKGLTLKVSGRVAILSCKEQQAFYEAIFEDYNTLVNYVKQTGTYDLEVEGMDLQAETLEKEVFIFGKGWRIDFGSDRFLEKVEANMLKKPFSKSEVEQMVDDASGGKTPEELQNELSETIQAFMLKRAQREEKDIEEYIRERIKNIPKEEKYGKAADKERYAENRAEELETGKKERILNMRKKLDNEFKFVHSFFSAAKYGVSIGCSWRKLGCSGSILGI